VSAATSSHSELRLQFGGLDVKTAPDGDGHVVTLSGELDLVTAGPLDLELARVENGGSPRIVVDLNGLSFLDSTGIHLLARAHLRVQADDRTFQVRVEPGTPAHRVLDASGILSVLAPEEEALAA
jgi:anti-sigma B factor antagonist